MMVTSNGDKNTVENDEGCLRWFRDYRVRHKKVHLVIVLVSVIIITLFHRIILTRA